MEKFLAAFREIAGRMNVLESDPEAQCCFEYLSGALVWTDERPPFRVNAEELGALRMLWNYRTSLLLGTPRVEFQDIWDSALALAPQWPGFLPGRRQPNPDILALIPESQR